MQWIPPRHKVTLICRDGSRPAGRIAEFDSTRGTLQFMPVDARASMRALPATEVVRLEWRERGKPSVAAAVGGFVLGGLIGYAIVGLTLSPEDPAGLRGIDLKYVPFGIAITGLGAMFGTVAGAEASSARSHQDYAVDCEGGPENLPPRPRGRESSASGGTRHRSWDD